jgi:4-hydroxy-tetrahydrodipicolinate synthase
MAMPAPTNDWLSDAIADIPTPFDEAGEVDLATFAGLCERQIRAGALALVVAATAGEFTTLSSAECDALIRTAADTARGRVRIVAGAGSNSTRQAVELTRRAERAGADAVLSVVPYYNKPMQAGIAAHFRAVADATDLPVLLHDIPARTHRELADDTLLKLSESQTIIGLVDSSGDVARVTRLRPVLPKRFRLLSGDDVTALAFLASGGDGCVSTLSNIAPATCRGIFQTCRQGLMPSAREPQQRLATLAALVTQENPAAVKYALSLLGLMRPDVRLPLVALSDQAKTAVAAAMAAIAAKDITPGETNVSRAISARARAYSAARGGRP